MRVELPALTMLRCGSSDACCNALTNTIAWPKEVLRQLGDAFRTLEALDVAHIKPCAADDADSHGVHGVHYLTDLEHFCRVCRIRHLDLSTTPTPGGHAMPSRLEHLGSVLAEHAPLLESLAVHGLELREGPLLALAHGCSRLSRIHLIGCTYSCEALGNFLRSAQSLGHVDLSEADRSAWPASRPSRADEREHVEMLTTWIDERRATAGTPVLSLVLHGCSYADAVASHTPEIVRHSGPRIRLFDIVLDEIAHARR
jgi:hypothetical protein